MKRLALLLALLSSSAFAAPQATICDLNNNCATVVAGALSVTTGGGTPPTPSSCTSCATLSQASQHTLYSFEVNVNSTLWAANWYLMIFNAAAPPADGAVTPLKCFTVISSSTTPNPQIGGTYASAGISLPSGVSFAISTTGCATKTTASANGFISFDAQ